MRQRFASWRRRSRRFLAFLVVCTVAPALLLWWCAVVYFGRSFEEQARHRLGGVLQAHGRRLESHLQTRAAFLREAQRREEVRLALEGWDGRLDGEDASRLRAALQELLDSGAPFLAMFAGRGLEPPVAAATAPLGDLSWTTRDLPTGRRSRQALRLVADGAEPGAEHLGIAVPAAGAEGMWLGGVLEAGDLNDLLGGAGGAFIYLVRHDGIPLGSRASDPERLTEVATDLRRRGGWWKVRGAQGEPAFRRSEWLPAGIDLALVAELPAADVYAGLRGFHEILGLVALLGAGLTALGATLALRAVDRPVRGLELALESMAAGTAAPPVAGSGPEGELASGLLEQIQPTRENAARWKRRAERLETIAGRVADLALVECGRDGRIRSVSAGAARLTGRTEGTLAGEPLRAILEEADWERLAPRLFGGEAEVVEIRDRVRVRRRGGEPQESDLRILPLEEPGQEGFLVVLRETSPRTERETALAAAEMRLRSMVEGISDGVAVLRGEKLDYVNPALAGILGRPVADLAGKPLSDLVGARDLLPVLEALRSALRGAPPAAPLSITLTRPEPAGQRRVLLSLSPGPEPGTLLATVRDVTEMERAERALEQERRRLDLTLESTSDGILAVQYHASGSVVMLANRRLPGVFGLADLDLENSSGRAVWEQLGRALGTPPGWGERAALFDAPSDAAFTERLEVAVPQARTLEVYCGPIRDDRARVVGRVATFRDISDQRRAERALSDRSQELASSREELERAYRDLELFSKDLERRTQELTRLNRELKGLDEMKSGLLANVSHELQTPLVSVKGYTEMILKEKLGPLTEEQRRGLEVSLKNVNRLIGLIDNLLSFSRMEGEMAELRLEAFPLRPLVDEVVETLRERARERQVEIELAGRFEDLTVKADRDKISQVFVNLISNAIKFSRPGGRIWIEAEAGRRGFIKVEVRDTGIGIPREALDKIFERFYQVDPTASRRREGTGIGLSIVKNILRMHGCMIRADSVPGEGSVFSFTLPAARRARHERSPLRAEGEETAGGAGAEDGPRSPRPSRPLGDETQG